MAHWKNRPEPGWGRFRFRQPYEKGLARLRNEVLGKTDFDPATLWQWGTMQAMAIIEVLGEAERALGKEGQELVHRALRRVGLDIGRQVLAEAERPAADEETEFLSYYATVINRIAYASLEAPRIDGPNEASFDIVWCPHQDHYGAFDCRVQRYFVEGMLTAAAEWLGVPESEADGFFQVFFTSTIPSGANVCHFVLKRGSAEERSMWKSYTELLEDKALRRSQKKT